MSVSGDALAEALRAGAMGVVEETVDPFSHSALAKILWIAGRQAEGKAPIVEAIRLEEARLLNEYVTDRRRLKEYQELLTKWNKTEG